eukprot:TRINITY_DN21415_c0_g1_i2.p1 TRINITY_DN21415_c0_g1~~TRINITY_DN21415_c0_g1_i2.p1  ORF type:complete len:411 (+),score=29.98 TRINITY_DN21415_c0_g1_i2:439-1671(+)
MQDYPVAVLGSVMTRFLVGYRNPDEGDNILVEAALQAEQKKHRDLLRLNVTDTYDNLTRKTLAFFRWFISADGPRTRYLMKLDDDSFPHLDLVLDALRAEDSYEYSYLGYFHFLAPVHRDGKNFEPASNYDAVHFPTYASGSGYILSKALVRNVVGNLYDHPTVLRNEDASVGVWVDHALSILPVHFMPLKATLFGCAAGDTLSLNLRLGELPCMWAKRQEDEHLRCCLESDLEPFIDQPTARMPSSKVSFKRVEQPIKPASPTSSASRDDARYAVRPLPNQFHPVLREFASNNPFRINQSLFLTEGTAASQSYQTNLLPSNTTLSQRHEAHDFIGYLPSTQMAYLGLMPILFPLSYEVSLVPSDGTLFARSSEVPSSYPHALFSGTGSPTVRGYPLESPAIFLGNHAAF